MTRRNEGEQLHLVVLPASGREGVNYWRRPGFDTSLQARVDAITQTARAAEKATFDAILFADFVAGATSPEAWRYQPTDNFEPLVVAAYVAAQTSDIGVVPTLSSTFDEPYHVARRILALDHLSHGRGGWNVVTSISEGAAKSFGLADLPDHAVRYERAAEVADAVISLWDSLDEDAVVADPESGEFHDPAHIHVTRREGRHVRTESVLGARRSVQGRPVVFQAGSSPDGIELGTQFADAVFFGKDTIEEALRFGETLRARANAYGRARPPLAFSSLSYIVASTEEEVRRIEDRIAEGIRVEQSLSFFQRYFGDTTAKVKVDDLDAPLPELPTHTERQQTALDYFRRVAAERPYTIREFLARTHASYFFYRAGTPEQIAGSVVEWFNRGAADGFALIPKYDVLQQVEAFGEQVVPLLRKAGIFRHEYEGSTLRDHLGIDRPTSVHTRAKVSQP